MAGNSRSPEPASDSLLQLRGLSKVFNSVRAVDQISIDVRKGEVLTLLGPSGCGKTTTLRMVMGLDRCDEGEIIYQGKVVDSATRGIYLPTHKRQMGMVFQSYAIWPHMTVYENVAYPLRVRRLGTAKTREAVSRALELVGLTGYKNRPAPNLSGGQQQRVALARSLVFEPQILLLDEPFSNLDARLREQMRAEVRILQRRLGITILFVTHDQVEALSLSDRIVVMKNGRIEQVGTPRELYERPATAAVRDFLGQTIALDGRIVEGRADEIAVELAEGLRLRATGVETDRRRDAGSPCTITIRPEKVEIEPVTDDDALGQNRVRATIELLLFIGDRYEARLALSGRASILLYLPASSAWREGQDVILHLPAGDIQVWPT